MNKTESDPIEAMYFGSHCSLCGSRKNVFDGNESVVICERCRDHGIAKIWEINAHLLQTVHMILSFLRERNSSRFTPMLRRVIARLVETSQEIRGALEERNRSEPE